MYYVQDCIVLELFPSPGKLLHVNQGLSQLVSLETLSDSCSYPSRLPVIPLTLHDLILLADNASAHLLVYYVHAAHAAGSPGSAAEGIDTQRDKKGFRE